MRLHLTKAIQDIAREKFQAMLVAGCFPKVQYKRDEKWETYSMMDYSVTWATFVKVLDIRMKEAGLDTSLGVYTRKHSAQLLAKTKELAEKITDTDVYAQPTRFGTMWD